MDVGRWQVAVGDVFEVSVQAWIEPLFTWVCSCSFDLFVRERCMHSVEGCGPRMEIGMLCFSARFGSIVGGPRVCRRSCS